ncbi:MAG: ion transporter [Kiritimatiellae bacterium]|nr:ion transporter [Kiritimatiellia bacterium]
MSGKQKVFDVIQPVSSGDFWSASFDILITLLIFTSVASLYIITFDIPPEMEKWLVFLEVAVSSVFTVEYILRIWTADLLYPGCGWLRARMKYIFSGPAVIDLLAILPFWLPMLLPGSMLGIRALRLLRLMRICKLNRYSDAVAFIGEAVKAKKNELVGSVCLIGLLMLVSSLLIHAAEHDAQPEVFRNAFSGLWWAVATLTTVGYGDIYPVTIMGRIMGAIIAFLGLAAVAVPTGIISSGLIEHIGHERRDGSATRGVRRCPRCGREIS